LRRWSTSDGLSKLDVFEAKEEEGSRGGVNSVGGMKAMRCWFISFSRAWKRAADGDARCSSRPGRWWLKRPKRKKCLGWAGLGRDGPEDSTNFGVNDRKSKWAENRAG
jgi:hypothetical protein